MKYFAKINSNGICVNTLGTSHDGVSMEISEGETVMEISEDILFIAVGKTLHSIKKLLNK